MNENRQEATASGDFATNLVLRRSRQIQTLDKSNGLGIHRVFLVILSFVTAVASTELAAPFMSPTNIFAPASTPAKSIFGLSLFVLAVTAPIFVVVFILLAYCVVKFRKRTNDDGREPAQVYGSNQVELAWKLPAPLPLEFPDVLN